MNYLYAALSAAGLGVFFGLTIGFGLRATGGNIVGPLLMIPLVLFVMLPMMALTAWLFFFGPR